MDEQRLSRDDGDGASIVAGEARRGAAMGSSSLFCISYFDDSKLPLRSNIIFNAFIAFISAGYIPYEIISKMKRLVTSV